MTDKAYHAYIGWLAAQIQPNRRRNLEELIHIMHAKEFVYILANDDSRIQDARDVRSDYFREMRIKPYVDVDILGPISVLEILIAISRRMAFMTGVPAGEWAWVLIQNLNLDQYSGRVNRLACEEIEEILERLIWRQYEPNGHGGLFPLVNPREDQRDVEIWYQMAAYLAEEEL